MKIKWVDNPNPVWEPIKHRMSDDSGQLITSGKFLGVFDGSDNMMMGAFQIKPWSTHCYEIHGGIHPTCSGLGVNICYEVGLYLFAYTPCLKIVAIIPKFNRLMRRCVQKCGMKEEGIIKKAFMRWHQMHDLYVYGIKKSEVKELCHQQQ